jgi:hypothetical protein
MEEIALISAALALAEKLLPRLDALVKSGQITPAQQQAVRDRYLALRAKADAAFQGPEWEPG